MKNGQNGKNGRMGWSGTRLAGYCEKCGLMRMMKEFAKPCVKCGSKRIVSNAPAPAGALA
jgi:hypothetical protein